MKPFFLRTPKEYRIPKSDEQLANVVELLHDWSEGKRSLRDYRKVEMDWDILGALIPLSNLEEIEQKVREYILEDRKQSIRFTRKSPHIDFDQFILYETYLFEKRPQRVFTIESRLFPKPPRRGSIGYWACILQEDDRYLFRHPGDR